MTTLQTPPQWPSDYFTPALQGAQRLAGRSPDHHYTRMQVPERSPSFRPPWGGGGDDMDPEDENGRPRPPPAVREDGEPSPLLFECPGDRVLDYETVWYHLLDLPDCLVCTRCHAQHLDRTDLERAFRPTQRTGGRCCFHTPRITRSLLPAARRTGSLQELRAFLARRAAVADCRGPAGATGEHRTRWFRLARNEIEGFIVCEACHEDVVQATPFGGPGYFVEYGASQPAGQTWSCALCVPYVRRALLRFARRPDGWGEWITSTSRRLRLRPCDGRTPVDPSSREWVRTSHPIGSQGTSNDGSSSSKHNNDSPLVFCETCYLDRLALTALDHDFEFIPPTKQQRPQPRTSPLAEQPRLWTCGTGAPSLSIGLETAVRRKDFRIFWDVARTVVSSRASPPCTLAGAQGVIDGGGITTWYALPGEGCDDFRVCSACYAGIFEAQGLGRFLQPESQNYPQRAKPGAQGRSAGSPTMRTAASTSLCSFNPTHPRHEQYLARLAEAVDTGVWARFAAYVRRWASVPPCPRAELVAGRRWYGYGDMTVCPECWGTFCHPDPPSTYPPSTSSSSYSASSYASSSNTTSPTMSSSSASVLSSSSSSSSALSPLPVPLRNELISKSRMCCLYSPRMRAKWREACVRGDPTELVEFSRLRMATYGQTMLQIKTLQHLQQEERGKAQAGRSGGGKMMHSGMVAGSDLATNMKIIQLSQKWADVE